MCCLSEIYIEVDILGFFWPHYLLMQIPVSLITGSSPRGRSPGGVLAAGAWGALDCDLIIFSPPRPARPLFALSWLHPMSAWVFFFFCMDFDVLSSQRFRQEVRINPRAQDTKSASNDTTFSLANHRVKDASEFLTPRPLYLQFISLSFISRVPPPIMG